MTERAARDNAYLRALLDGKHVIAQAVRERSTTLGRGNPLTARRWWFALAAAATLVVAACGGGKQPDTYARGTQVQEQCCEHLAEPGRSACLKEVVRIDDPGAARTATNQQTFACIVEHFVCDPTTGHETPASAQAQHDCTDDLQ